MKLPALLLASSLVANAALVGVLISRTSEPGGKTAIHGLHAAAAATAGSSSEPGRNAPSAAGTAVDNTPVPRSQIWSALQADDLKAYVAHLRAAGFPEKTIRTLVGLALAERHAERRKELESGFSETPYWRQQTWWGNEPKKQAALNQLWREHRETLDQLLGPDPDEPVQARSWRQRQYGGIPREKVDEIQRLQQDYGELSQEINRAAKGFLLPEDREKLAFLEKEKLADLHELLTPDEFLEYQLRNSPAANQLRNDFRQIELTEEEFRALYALRAAVDEQLGNPDPFLSRKRDQAEGRDKAETQLREQYRTVLGEERYAEYLRSREGNYEQLRRLAERLELPKETAANIHHLQKSTEQKANEIRRNSKLKPEERNAQLSALATTVKTMVSTALGSRGYEAYLEQGCYWLRNLEPPKPSPSPNNPRG